VKYGNHDASFGDRSDKIPECDGQMDTASVASTVKAIVHYAMLPLCNNRRRMYSANR